LIKKELENPNEYFVGMGHEKRKISWLKWNDICINKEYGG